MILPVSPIFRKSGFIFEGRESSFIKAYLVVCHLITCREKTVSPPQDISHIKIYVRCLKVAYT